MSVETKSKPKTKADPHIIPQGKIAAHLGSEPAEHFSGYQDITPPLLSQFAFQYVDRYPELSVEEHKDYLVFRGQKKLEGTKTRDFKEEEKETHKMGKEALDREYAGKIIKFFENNDPQKLRKPPMCRIQDVIAEGKKQAEIKGRPSFSILEASDAQKNPKFPAFQDAVMVMASQANCLESPGRYITSPVLYPLDPTQGPKLALNTLDATLARFAYKEDCDMMQAWLDKYDPIQEKSGERACFDYQSGYLTPKPGKVNQCNDLLVKHRDEILINLQQARVDGTSQNITQIPCFAFALGKDNDPYSKEYQDQEQSRSKKEGKKEGGDEIESKPLRPDTDKQDISAACQTLLTLQYQAAAHAAVIKSRQMGKRIPLVLPLIGAGAFANPPEAVAAAIQSIEPIVRNANVDVIVSAYSQDDQELCKRITFLNNAPKITHEEMSQRPAPKSTQASLSLHTVAQGVANFLFSPAVYSLGSFVSNAAELASLSYKTPETEKESTPYKIKKKLLQHEIGISFASCLPASLAVSFMSLKPKWFADLKDALGLDNFSKLGVNPQQMNNLPDALENLETLVLVAFVSFYILPWIFRNMGMHLSDKAILKELASDEKFVQANPSAVTMKKTLEGSTFLKGSASDWARTKFTFLGVPRKYSFLEAEERNFDGSTVTLNEKEKQAIKEVFFSSRVTADTTFTGLLQMADHRKILPPELLLRLCNIYEGIIGSASGFDSRKSKEAFFSKLEVASTTGVLDLASIKPTNEVVREGEYYQGLQTIICQLQDKIEPNPSQGQALA